MEDLMSEAVQYLEEAQARLKRVLSLGVWKRYHLDQEKGTIEFSSDGQVGLVADLHVVGSTSRSTGTWLWSWDNPSILPKVRHCMEEVRAYGQAHNVERLVNAKWSGDERDGWEMTAIAAYLLKADGGYRAPGEKGALFAILKNPRRTS
jgi:hypothetical protein